MHENYFFLNACWVTAVHASPKQKTHQSCMPLLCMHTFEYLFIMDYLKACKPNINIVSDVVHTLWSITLEYIVYCLACVKHIKSMKGYKCILF